MATTSAKSEVFKKCEFWTFKHLKILLTIASLQALASLAQKIKDQTEEDHRRTDDHRGHRTKDRK